MDEMKMNVFCFADTIVVGTDDHAPYMAINDL